MKSRIQNVASKANLDVYTDYENYINEAPHLKHKSIRNLYSKLIEKVFNRAASFGNAPKILDMGAGEGTATLPFLELGGEVTAVDSSEDQLKMLQNKCTKFSHALDIRCIDICEFLKSEDNTYDIVMFNSFLHHIPDYIDLLGKTMPVLKSGGCIYSFQDPMYYDSVKIIDSIYSNLAYFFWRICQDDAFRGMWRWLRRRAGIYKEHSVHDNAEYHVVRNGVNQIEIKEFLENNSFKCELVPYFSTQNGFFQILGDFFKFKNTFAIIAIKI